MQDEQSHYNCKFVADVLGKHLTTTVQILQELGKPWSDAFVSSLGNAALSEMRSTSLREDTTVLHAIS